MKRSFLTAIFTATAMVAVAQNLSLIGLQRKIAAQADIYTNGYAEALQGDQAGFFNQWNNKTEVIIARANNKVPTVKWMSESVGAITDGYVNFMLLWGVDQNLKEDKFNILVNGNKIAQIENFHSESYSKQGELGAEIIFERINDYPEGSGYYFVTIRVPESIAPRGKAVEFEIDGSASSSDAWLMPFMNRDLVEEIVMRSLHDESYHIERNIVTGDVMIYAPSTFVGKEVLVESPKGSKKVTFAPSGKLAQAKIAALGEEFAVKDGGKTIIDVNDQIKSGSSYSGNIVTKIDVKEVKALVNIDIKKKYSPYLDEMKMLSKSPFGDSKVYVMVSSHQDIAWVDNPYNCIEARDKLIVSPALALLEKYPDYRYDIEDALILSEYLERHPNKRPLIAKLIEEGRLAVGASYTQPYEEMQTGEALARQIYYGKRWVDKEFMGSNARTYWNVDVPGRTLQMAQILAKCGVKYFQYSRHDNGIFRWSSPDSSSIVVHTPDHYGAAAGFLRSAPEEGVEGFNNYINSFPDYRSDKSKPAVLGMLSSEDMSAAHTYYTWRDGFNAYQDTIGGTLPEVVHSTSDMFMDAFMAQNPKLGTISGERPNMWLYIHGPGHHRAISAYRKATRQATAAETFATVEGLLRGDFSRYPKKELDVMWRDLIYADHGWGGNDGTVTDSLFKARYQNAEVESAKMVQNSTDYIASQVAVSEKLGVPIVIFNQLSYSYTSPVEVEIELPSSGFSIVNSKGEAIPYQIVKSSGSRATIEFIASDMPSVGYQTYYVSDRPMKKGFAKRDALNSDFYAVDMVGGELKQIYDKELGAELFDTSKFGIGEIFTVESIGNGAGEFFSMQLTSMNGYESTAGASWEMVEDGDVYTLYCSKSKFEDADIVRHMKIYKGIKRIEFPSQVNNFSGKVYREFRQTFPLVAKGEVSYEVPFGTSTVGKDELKFAAGARYNDMCEDIHPRGIINWIGAKCGEVDVKISSSVTVADYIDPTDNPVESTVLQPILFASRKSCHGNGPFYKQPGDHSFNFVLNSTSSSDPLSQIKAVASNYLPYTVYAPQTSRKAYLPESATFFGVDNDGVAVSTIKKCEDDESVVIRLYDATELGGVDVNISSMFDIESMQHTDMLELHGKATNVAKIGNRSVETFKLDIK